MCFAALRESVLLVACHSVPGPQDLCAHLASLCQHYENHPSALAEELLCYTAATLGPVKPSPITVTGTMGCSQDRSP